MGMSERIFTLLPFLCWMGMPSPVWEVGSSAGFLRKSVCHGHCVCKCSVTGVATQPLHKSWLQPGQPEYRWNRRFFTHTTTGSTPKQLRITSG